VEVVGALELQRDREGREMREWRVRREQAVAQAGSGTRAA
jgi:hypothetical protein